jgi:hypothetical protein
VYSASAYLSFVHHNGLATELALTALARKVLSGAPQSELRRVLATIRHPMSTPGAAKMLARG